MPDPELRRSSSSSLPSPRALLTRILAGLSAPISSPDADDHDVPPPPGLTPAATLRALPEKQRNLLLTLHVLFPHELLPALDLLDRGCVMRLSVIGASSGGDAAAVGSSAEEKGTRETGGSGNADADADASADAGPAQHSASTSSIAAGRARRHGGSGSSSGRTSAPQPPPIYYVRSAQPRPQQHWRSRNRHHHDDDDNDADDAGPTHYEVRLAAWSCSCPAFAVSAFPALSADASRKLEDCDDGVVDGEDDSGVDSFGGLRSGKDLPPVCKHLLASVLAERAGWLFGAAVGVVGEGQGGVSAEAAAGWAAGWGG
ncbi:uncharacterized protein K452DRAFT_305041 [Aplosporella prunicola CBS 121167]|uniref:SWIM-type domain-containing protein n=1 Tax=Aplosporella prunicola CBS 121167 TaxID=1176127 RepID=A0A6A6BRG9_9PEZI|nr:uncharacterized protein K452DRAFT_305041 [Aplosporella prunicola CBS 121167]KAF2146053.1 hypothetical protein K452DRAFT_305041 [Aplosporella prunicola CBS 121167]